MIRHLFLRTKPQPQWPSIRWPSKPLTAKPQSGTKQGDSGFVQCHSGDSGFVQWHSGACSVTVPLQWCTRVNGSGTVVSAVLQWCLRCYSGDNPDPDGGHSTRTVPRRVPHHYSGYCTHRHYPVYTTTTGPRWHQVWSRCHLSMSKSSKLVTNRCFNNLPSAYKREPHTC